MALFGEEEKLNRQRQGNTATRQGFQRPRGGGRFRVPALATGPGTIPATQLGPVTPTPAGRDLRRVLNGQSPMVPTQEGTNLRRLVEEAGFDRPSSGGRRRRKRR